MTTYDYTAPSATTTTDTVGEVYYLRNENSALRSTVNNHAARLFEFGERVRQQLQLLVDDDALSLENANDMLDALGIEQIKIVKEYEVTLSGTWYVTVTVEATDPEDADTQCEDITIDLDVDLGKVSNMTLHAAELEHDNTQVEEA